MDMGANFWLQASWLAPFREAFQAVASWLTIG